MSYALYDTVYLQRSMVIQLSLAFGFGGWWVELLFENNVFIYYVRLILIGWGLKHLKWGISSAMRFASAAAVAGRVQVDGDGIAAIGFRGRHGRMFVLLAHRGRNTRDAQQAESVFQLLVPLHSLDVLLLQMALVHQDCGLLFVPHLSFSFYALLLLNDSPLESLDFGHAQSGGRAVRFGFANQFARGQDWRCDTTSVI